MVQIPPFFSADVFKGKNCPGIYLFYLKVEIYKWRTMAMDSSVDSKIMVKPPDS